MRLDVFLRAPDPHGHLVLRPRYSGAYRPVVAAAHGQFVVNLLPVIGHEYYYGIRAGIIAQNAFQHVVVVVCGVVVVHHGCIVFRKARKGLRIVAMVVKMLSLEVDNVKDRGGSERIGRRQFALQEIVVKVPRTCVAMRK